MSKGLLVCGWCMTGHHDGCKSEIKYYDKIWKCLCKICNGDINSNDTTEEEETND